MEATSRPLPAGVTKPNATLSDYQIHMILVGLMIPDANGIHALAKEIAKQRGINF